MAQNEMKAKPALPERVRSMEGLGRTRHIELCCGGQSSERFIASGGKGDPLLHWAPLAGRIPESSARKCHCPRVLRASELENHGFFVLGRKRLAAYLEAGLPEHLSCGDSRLGAETLHKLLVLCYCV